MQRNLYTTDHNDFRSAVRTFVEREVLGNVESWENAGMVPREVWEAAGEQGIIGLSAPTAHAAEEPRSDYRYRSVVLEELARVHATSLSAGFSVQDDIVIPYLSSLGTDEQQERWIPRMARGDLIGAVAMTEPDTGSDLRAIRTSATKVDGGWSVTGTKTFITNGIRSDIVVVAVRTGGGSDGSHALSLLVIEREMDGFRRGRKLNKIGLHGQDTAELIFESVFVPDENVLGTIGGGMNALMLHLPLERLSIAAQGVASAEAILHSTLDYTNSRTAFGRSVADFQNSRFVLADLATEIGVARTYVDKAILAWNAGELEAVDAAKAKLWSSEMQHRLIDKCLQLHGGYGYMLEYPVARAYQDARVQRIFGGTNEIMRHIIGRDVIHRHRSEAVS